MCYCIVECGLFDWDLIRAGHYGQRSFVPHQQAGHMAAPTSLQT
jgi:hypothetical protein